MKFRFYVDKRVAFYYWLQAIAMWDSSSDEIELYRHYRDDGDGLSDAGAEALLRVKKILSESTNPRGLLASMYGGDFSGDEAARLADLAELTVDSFDTYWKRRMSELNKWQKLLSEYDFSHVNGTLGVLNKILDSKVDEDEEIPVYLLPNLPSRGSSGHVIQGSRFILLHPAGIMSDNAPVNTVTTLFHEHIHVLEFNSDINSTLFRASHNLNVPEGTLPPKGYTWRMIYSELIAYCFANNITGGISRAYFTDKGSPTAKEFKDSYNSLAKMRNPSTPQRLSWAGLLISPYIEDCIKAGKKIDSEIADKISKTIAEVFIDI